MGPYYAGSHRLYLLLERLAIAGPRPDAAPTNGAHDGGGGARELLWGARRLVPAGVRRALRARLPGKARSLWRWAHGVESVYARRRAFALPTNNMTGAIRLNVKGREPSGLVAPGVEYDALCDALTEAMLELVNADTGRPAVRWVRRAAELYRGPRLGDLPDLFVEWDHDVPITTLSSPRIGTLTLPYRGDRTGDHRAGGLLLARGPGLRGGAEVKDMRAAPSITRCPATIPTLRASRVATAPAAPLAAKRCGVSAPRPRAFASSRPAGK
jgi:hypothetical protein